MKTSNPFLRDNVLENVYPTYEKTMSVSGTINKLLFLTLIMLAAVFAVYYQFSLGHIDYVNILMTVGIIVSLVCAVVIAFVNKLTPYLAPVYAFSQGAVLSGISCFFEKTYPGIVIQAVSITFLVLLTMIVLFKSGLIKVTNKFLSSLFIATSAIAIFYLFAYIISLFNVTIPYFDSGSNLSIVINAAIAVIAALNLVADFDFIEKGSSSGLPAVYEWYGAFGLLVTLLWLYLEILRLLARTMKR